uniref:HTH CENPB-type domain-containing protein n=1 Tax=Meloidogyne javanica TaxID=6303 RepID=A0A915ME94_MELJA
MTSSDSEIDVVSSQEEEQTIDVVSVFENEKTTRSRKRKSYSLSKKLEVIEYAKKNSKLVAAKRYGIDRKCIIDWVRKEEKLKSEAGSKKRLKGGGRHLKYSQLDEELAKWVREKRNEKHRVSRRIIQQQALKLFVPTDEEPDFKASIGWLQKRKGNDVRWKAEASVYENIPQVDC